jgi:hypothetical protein
VVDSVPQIRAVITADTRAGFVLGGPGGGPSVSYRIAKARGLQVLSYAIRRDDESSAARQMFGIPTTGSPRWSSSV